MGTERNRATLPVLIIAVVLIAGGLLVLIPGILRLAQIVPAWTGRLSTNLVSRLRCWRR